MLGLLRFDEGVLPLLHLVRRQIFHVRRERKDVPVLVRDARVVVAPEHVGGAISPFKPDATACRKLASVPST